MPGRIQRRASLSATPVRRGSMTGGKRGGGPSQIMLSWFQASETVEEEEITRPLSPPVADPIPPPVMEEVQITGLELLKKNPKFDEEESDDFSYDSYARDSFVLAGTRVRKMKPKLANIRLTQSEHQSKRFVPSEMDDDDDVDVDSMAGDYYDYGPSGRTNFYDYGPPSRSNYNEKDNQRWMSRRSSIGSYANDSIGFERYKSTRRGSVGSYANDSVECKNMSKSRFSNNNLLGVSWHGNNKYGRRGSLGRRSSLGSQTMDSSVGKRFVCRGSVMRRHSSHCGEMDMMRKAFDGPIMRRSSLGSCSSGVSLSVATSISAGFSRTA